MVETKVRLGDLETGTQFYLVGDRALSETDRTLVVAGGYGDSVLADRAVDESEAAAFDRDLVVLVQDED